MTEENERDLSYSGAHNTEDGYGNTEELNEVADPGWGDEDEFTSGEDSNWPIEDQIIGRLAASGSSLNKSLRLSRNSDEIPEEVVEEIKSARYALSRLLITGRISHCTLARNCLNRGTQRETNLDNRSTGSGRNCIASGILPHIPLSRSLNPKLYGD